MSRFAFPAARLQSTQVSWCPDHAVVALIEAWSRPGGAFPVELMVMIGWALVGSFLFFSTGAIRGLQQIRRFQHNATASDPSIDRA